jgi:hypothetical protein
VRRRKDDSVLAGFLNSIGGVLDEAKDTIQSLRRRGMVWVQDASHAYYSSEQRTADLDMHARDRGTRRFVGETNEQLAARLQAFPHVRRHMGSAMGMKFLVEEALGHQLLGVVVYSDDPNLRVMLSAEEQGRTAEENRSHILATADQGDPLFDDYRKNRMYSQEDLDYRYQFWISIGVPAGTGQEELDRITELVNEEKPAHVVARVHFVEV